MLSSENSKLNGGRTWTEGFLPPYTHSNVHVRKQVGPHDRTFVLQISQHKARAPIHGLLNHTHRVPCRRFGEQRLPLDSTFHRVELTIYRAFSTRTTVSASSRINRLRHCIVASVGLQALTFKVSIHVSVRYARCLNVCTSDSSQSLECLGARSRPISLTR